MRKRTPISEAVTVVSGDPFLVQKPLKNGSKNRSENDPPKVRQGGAKVPKGSPKGSQKEPKSENKSIKKRDQKQDQNWSEKVRF